MYMMMFDKELPLLGTDEAGVAVVVVAAACRAIESAGRVAGPFVATLAESACATAASESRRRAALCRAIESRRSESRCEK